MGYIMTNSVGPYDNPTSWIVDLWRELDDSSSLYEWHEVHSKEDADQLIVKLQAEGHILPDDDELGY